MHLYSVPLLSSSSSKWIILLVFLILRSHPLLQLKDYKSTHITSCQCTLFLQTTSCDGRLYHIQLKGNKNRTKMNETIFQRYKNTQKKYLKILSLCTTLADQISETLCCTHAQLYAQDHISICQVCPLSLVVRYSLKAIWAHTSAKYITLCQ